MAPQTVFNPLRVVTQRLTSTPAKQLPHVARYLASIISQNDKAFVTPTSKDQASTLSESDVIVHKFKTQISALLQDKSPEARYAAVILIKATVGAGDWNVLQSAGAWVRGLIGILGKPGSPATKQLCVITLTSIFMLNHQHQSLVREITTPSLPGFITACLNLVRNPRTTGASPEMHVPSPHLLVVLHALSELIAMHPTSFRPFAPQMQALTYPLIAPTPSSIENGSGPISTSVSESARRLFVSLHVCGPKNTASEEWAKSLNGLSASVQSTIDKVFRSVIEEWTPAIGASAGASFIPVEDVVSDLKPTPLALTAWNGIYAGVERLDGLLRTLQAFLASTNATVVTVPLGQIINLVDRVLSTFPPGDERNPRIRPEIERDEREGLWAGLPRLQSSAIGVYSLIISRIGHGSASLASTILEQILWSFESQYRNGEFRRAAYRLVSQILTRFGFSLPRTHAASLSRCVRMCCQDMLPSVGTQLKGGHLLIHETQRFPNGVTSSNTDSYLKPVSSQVDLSGTSIDVVQAAEELLPLTLSNLPNDYLPFSLRCQIDRTALVTDNKKATLASVMNPTFRRKGQKQTSSILPLLARAHSEALEVEALLRPQMPPVQFRRREGSEKESDDEDTYMHDYSQVGESIAFGHDSAGQIGNANVEKDKVTRRPNCEPVNTPPGAIEENIQSTEPVGISENTATGLTGPKSVFSYTSKKRDREEESGSDTKENVEDDIIEQLETASPGKRSRVDYNEVQEKSPLNLVPANPNTMDTGVPAQVSNITASSDSMAVSNGQPILRKDDSDESDFEMPILHMDPDTDEEEEEGGKDERDEEEEEEKEDDDDG